jgi:hypothetical protein
MWRGSILVSQRYLDLQGYCSIAKLRSITDLSGQNSSKLRQTDCDSFMGRSAASGSR